MAKKVPQAKFKTAKTEAQRLALFRKQLNVMPDEYVRCHNFGHSTYEATMNPDEGFVIGQVCYSCAMEIDRYRHPITGRWVTRYWHPKGNEYYFHGTGRTDMVRKQEIHDEWLRRTGRQLPARPTE
jgi:hypothetical protein